MLMLSKRLRRQGTICALQGMGGQHEYFGLWLSAEFGKGHSKAKPTCTTYKSPQLSCTEEFNVDAVEVWGLGDKVREEEDNEEVRHALCICDSDSFHSTTILSNPLSCLALSAGSCAIDCNQFF